jgi:hypothetical protein
LVHGLDMTFGVAALFGLVAFAMVAALVRLPVAQDAATVPTRTQGDEFELVDGEGFEWPAPDLVA